MIVTTVTSNDFHNAFKAMRPDQFSYDALEGLFNFFEEMSEDTGTPYELDVIAICCEFTEYDSMADAVLEYWDIDTHEDLHDHTIVIELHTGGVVIQQF